MDVPQFAYLFCSWTFGLFSVWAVISYRILLWTFVSLRSEIVGSQGIYRFPFPPQYKRLVIDCSISSTRLSIISLWFLPL